MGGYGSGRHSYKPVTSQVNRVDIRYMRRRGLLQPGTKGTLSWKCGDRPSGNVGYKIEGNTLTLVYSVRPRGGDWEPVILRVPIVRVPCRYGGHRNYFLCPEQRCNRRCEILYSMSNYFLCRKCCGYLYASQVNDRLDQLRDARAKVGAQIFEDFDGKRGWRKKKGMHQRTFDRGYARFRNLEELWSRQFVERSVAFLGSNLLGEPSFD